MSRPRTPGRRAAIHIFYTCAPNPSSDIFWVPPSQTLQKRRLVPNSPLATCLTLEYARLTTPPTPHLRGFRSTSSRGPPSRRDDDRRPPDNSRPPRIITLSSPPGCPPFEVHGDQNLLMLREMVDLIQFRLPPVSPPSA